MLMRYYRHWLLCIAVMIAMGGVSTLSAARAELALEGLNRADSTLQGELDGEHWLLMMLWSTACSICRAEMPTIQSLSERTDETGIRVVGLVLEGPEQQAHIRQTISELGITFANFTAPSEHLVAAYGEATSEQFRGTPTFLLYTPDGELVGNNPGPIRPGAVERFIEKYNKTHP